MCESNKCVWCGADNASIHFGSVRYLCDFCYKTVWVVLVDAKVARKQMPRSDILSYALELRNKIRAESKDFSIKNGDVIGGAICDFCGESKGTHLCNKKNLCCLCYHSVPGIVLDNKFHQRSCSNEYFEIYLHNLENVLKNKNNYYYDEVKLEQAKVNKSDLSKIEQIKDEEIAKLTAKVEILTKQVTQLETENKELKIKNELLNARIDYVKNITARILNV